MCEVSISKMSKEDNTKLLNIEIINNKLLEALDCSMSWEHLILNH